MSHGGPGEARLVYGTGREKEPSGGHKEFARALRGNSAISCTSKGYKEDVGLSTKRHLLGVWGGQPVMQPGPENQSINIGHIMIGSTESFHGTKHASVVQPE